MGPNTPTSSVCYVVLFDSFTLCAFVDGLSLNNQTEKHAIQWKVKVSLVRQEGVWGNEVTAPPILNLDDKRK